MISLNRNAEISDGPTGPSTDEMLLAQLNVPEICDTLIPRDKLRAIMLSLAKGNKIKHAVESQYFSYHKFKKWMALGEAEANDSYNHLYLAVKQAQAVCICQCVYTLFESARTDWRAAKYILECKVKEWLPWDRRNSLDQQLEMILKAAKKVLPSEHYISFLHQIEAES